MYTTECKIGVNVACMIWACPIVYISGKDYLPFGKPSCCISLSRELPSTECLAALDKMKAMAATEALMSLVSNLASEVNLATFSY